MNPLAATPNLKTAQSPAQEVYEDFRSDRMEEAPTSGGPTVCCPDADRIASATFMYNGREIEYCARGLLRDYDNKVGF